MGLLAPPIKHGHPPSHVMQIAASAALTGVSRKVPGARGPGAKKAGIVINFRGSDPVTIDLTALIPTEQVGVDGDQSFSRWTGIAMQWVGRGPLAVSPGESNPLCTPLTGQSPVHTLEPGDFVDWIGAGRVINSMHRTLTFTPSGDGVLAMGIAGR